jgi:hypothetical protein
MPSRRDAPSSGNGGLTPYWARRFGLTFFGKVRHISLENILLTALSPPEKSKILLCRELRVYILKDGTNVSGFESNGIIQKNLGGGVKKCAI